MSSYLDYGDIAVTTDVTGSSPHRLIQLLFEKCLQHINSAKLHIEHHEVGKKIASVNKALDIFGYLRGCLNLDSHHTRELASQLDMLYDYLERIIILANTNNAIAQLDEAATLLSVVKSGWDGIS